MKGKKLAEDEQKNGKENETEDKKDNGFEHDIYRLMQIREQFHNEVKKIGAHITTLDQTNKRFVAHFDVFEEMSEKAEKNIEKITQDASYSMGKAAAKDFAELIKQNLNENVNALNVSVQRAHTVLSETMGHKYRRLALQCFIGSCLLGLVCFGGGIYYAKQRLFKLPPDVVYMYYLGKKAQNEALKKREEEKRTKQRKSEKAKMRR